MPSLSWLKQNDCVWDQTVLYSKTLFLNLKKKWDRVEKPSSIQFVVKEERQNCPLFLVSMGL